MSRSRLTLRVDRIWRPSRAEGALSPVIGKHQMAYIGEKWYASGASTTSRALVESPLWRYTFTYDR